MEMIGSENTSYPSREDRDLAANLRVTPDQNPDSAKNPPDSGDKVSIEGAPGNVPKLVNQEITDMVMENINTGNISFSS